MILKSESVRLDAKIGDVRLVSAKVHLLRIPLRRPFVISLGVQPDYLGTIVELGSDERTGYGEGSTIPQITGESPEGVAATAKWILNALAGRTFGGLEDFSAFVDAAIHANPTAKSAIDIAVHDLLGKTWNLHVIRMLGGRFADLPTSLTIGLVPVDESLRQLEELQAEKCQFIKVKVGGKVEDDIARVRAIAERLSTERFYVDANQGYSLRDALRLSPVLQESGALFFEQPLGRHAYEDLRALRKSSGVAVMLDESISSPRDVIEAVRREAADYVNVKLTKSGGIHQAMKTLIRLFPLTMLPIPEATRSRFPRFKQASADLDLVTEALIANPRSDLARNALIQILKQNTGGQFTDEQIRAHVLTFMLAGHETTALLLAWAWELLAHDPQAQGKLQAEVDCSLSDRLPTAEDLKQLTYTQAVVKETLRLRPPAWVVGRQAIEDCQIGGYTIPAGSNVLMSQWVMHHDPRFYYQPELFRPERWLEPFGAALPRFAYFPFGGGSRVCIGEHFARTEAVAVLAYAVRRWQVSPVSAKLAKPNPSVTLRPRNGIPLRVEKREN